jgi:hypothetical protein
MSDDFFFNDSVFWEIKEDTDTKERFIVFAVPSTLPFPSQVVKSILDKEALVLEVFFIEGQRFEVWLMETFDENKTLLQETIMHQKQPFYLYYTGEDYETIKVQIDIKGY